MSRIVHFDQIKSEPYPIGEIPPYRENTGQDIIIAPRWETNAERGWEIAEERRKKGIEIDPQVMPEPLNSSEPIDRTEGPPMSKRQMKRMRRKQMMKQRNANNKMKRQQEETSNELGGNSKQLYVTQFGRTIRRPKRYDNCYAVQNQNLPPVWHQLPSRRK